MKDNPTGGPLQPITGRDYFAAKALQGVLACGRRTESKQFRDEIACEAYLLADAMLRVRNGATNAG